MTSHGRTGVMALLAEVESYSIRNQVATSRSMIVDPRDTTSVNVTPPCCSGLYHTKIHRALQSHLPLFKQIEQVAKILCPMAVAATRRM